MDFDLNPPLDEPRLLELLKKYLLARSADQEPFEQHTIGLGSSEAYYDYGYRHAMRDVARFAGRMNDDEDHFIESVRKYVHDRRTA